MPALVTLSPRPAAATAAPFWFQSTGCGRGAQANRKSRKQLAQKVSTTNARAQLAQISQLFARVNMQRPRWCLCNRSGASPRTKFRRVCKYFHPAARAGGQSSPRPQTERIVRFPRQAAQLNGRIWQKVKLIRQSSRSCQMSSRAVCRRARCCSSLWPLTVDLLQSQPGSAK